MTEHDDALSLDMVTAALRADSTDVAIYARVLAQSLGEALPADCVSVERDRSMSDRMRGRPGEISKIVARLGELQMTLAVRNGQPVAEVGRGDVVGESALLGDHYRNATVTATTEVAALVMSVREFNTLMELPGVAGRIRGLDESRRGAAGGAFAA